MGALAKKPIAKKSDFGDKSSFDPFMPPFEEGLYIDDITPTHRLLFNKF